MWETLRVAAKQRAQGHLAEQSSQLVVGEEAAVGRGVDQLEGHVRGRPGPLEAERGVVVQPPELGGPEVDVLPLESAHPLARVVRQRLPVAVLDDDQRRLGDGELVQAP